MGRLISHQGARTIAQLIVSVTLVVVSAGAAHATGLGCKRSEASSVSSAATSEEKRQVFWGDLHTHTAFSMDAYVLNTQLTPEDAYAFARGEPSPLHGGGTHQLSRPLDFAAVTDHAEYFGLTKVCMTQPELPYCAKLAEAAQEDSTRGFVEIFLPLIVGGERNCLVDNAACRIAEQSLWERTINAANAANEPCKFTAFVANEWTASPGNLHWHRNLIYLNDKVPQRALNSFDQPSQEKLWEGLDAQCIEADGCRVLAIPHNSNIGMGGAFQTTGHSAATHALRARFEKLVEIHQHKGSSECYSQSNFSDEACDFEFMMPIPLRNKLLAKPRDLTAAEERDVAKGYVRDTLARGLQVRDASGINPFRYGFVGATDSHSGRPGDVQEDEWAGSLGQWDRNAGKQTNFPVYNPGGITGIWAQENTRAALFAALERREVYATSGPRITLQFEQSFSPGEQCDSPGARAVRMGGSVQQNRRARRSKALPTFTLRALQDRTPLQRVDIVKLALVDGEIEQTLHSVTGDRNGRADWCVAWQDRNYNPNQPALWYARVLQVPTLRWDGTNKIRERAWSSPIWALPAGG